MIVSIVLLFTYIILETTYNAFMLNQYECFMEYTGLKLEI